MHVVTKFLVVFCAILCLLLSALTIAYASNAKALGDSYRNVLAERDAVKAHSSLEVAESATRQAKAEEENRSLQETLTRANQEIANLQVEKSSRIAELEQARAEAAAIRNQVNQTVATADTQAALIKRYAEENGQLRDQLIQVSKREIELTDRISDLESAREVLEQNARALKEQLEETKLALQQAQSGTVAGSSTTATGRLPELTGPIIRARINEVFSSPVGNMVVVSEGANRGIKEGIQLNVVRGNQFIGTLEVRTVEPTQCVALVRFLNADAKVQKDDVVLSRLQ